uniref:Uncharacterized protein n=1 Tax=Peronospora matthiolae TaxID=2874970 RepID=A0AAV1TVE0_9STRA
MEAAGLQCERITCGRIPSSVCTRKDVAPQVHTAMSSDNGTNLVHS